MVACPFMTRRAGSGWNQLEEPTQRSSGLFWRPVHGRREEARAIVDRCRSGVCLLHPSTSGSAFLLPAATVSRYGGLVVPESRAF